MLSEWQDVNSHLNDEPQETQEKTWYISDIFILYENDKILGYVTSEDKAKLYLKNLMSDKDNDSNLLVRYELEENRLVLYGRWKWSMSLYEFVYKVFSYDRIANLE